jgi:hypothetical protein
MNKKKLLQFLFLLGTCAGAAALNYSILHTPFIFVILFVLLAHEVAHYITAKLHNGDPDLPYFIPLPIFPIGITRIKNMRRLSADSKRQILLYGPVVGFIVSFLLSLLSFVYLPEYFIPLLILSFGEIVFNYFGSDGKKYRSYKYG